MISSLIIKKMTCVLGVHTDPSLMAGDGGSKVSLSKEGRSKGGGADATRATSAPTLGASGSAVVLGKQKPGEGGPFSVTLWGKEEFAASKKVDELRARHRTLMANFKDPLAAPSGGPGAPSGGGGEKRVEFDSGQSVAGTSEPGDWMERQYKREGKRGELLQRSLMVNDISRAMETQAGVCVLKIMDLPKIRSSDPMGDYRLERVNEQLDAMNKSFRSSLSKTQLGTGRRAVTVADLERQSKRSGPDSAAAGGSNEFLPKQQIYTAGKPTLCRPMITDSAYGMVPMLTKDDSLFASENRANFFWKKQPDEDLRKSKSWCRPMDAKYRYRENMTLLSGCLRTKVCSF